MEDRVSIPFSSPPRADRHWESSNLLSNGYRKLLLR